MLNNLTIKESEKNILSIIDTEIKESEYANRDEFDEFDSLEDMIECIRSEKDYEWMSNNFIPELPAIIHTEASLWANQYFQTRDFVDCKLEGDNPLDEKKSIAAKILINKILNSKHIKHYLKYIRLRLINSLKGQVWVRCWWEQKTEDLTGSKEITIENINLNQPYYRIIYDRFNYDVIHPRNIFYNYSYSYSPQEKDYIIVRSETTYEKLLENKESCKYFNLDIVKELMKSNVGQTKTEQVQKTPVYSRKRVIKKIDLYERFGKFWAVVEEKNELGEISEISYGYDDLGNIKENAELVESIITFVEINGTKVLIGFRPTPYYDAKGEPYKPFCRGICYIHPTKDVGIGDGKYLKEAQASMNDFFNMAADRVKLATLPVMKGRKYALVDNDTIFYEPGHVMELENPEDIQEMKITQDINGALGLINMLMGFCEKSSSIYPTTMGDIPRHASTTATAIQGAEQRTNLRSNFKALTFEYTFFQDFYWMILNMAYRFMKPETAFNLLGEYVVYFDPNADYVFQPVSSNVELENNRKTKLMIIDQFVGRVAQIPNPNTPLLLNYLLSKAFELFGDLFPEYSKYLLDTSQIYQQMTNKSQNLNKVSDMKEDIVNQTGKEMSLDEKLLRREAQNNAQEESI